MRRATVTRKTKETELEVTVDLDGTGTAHIATGIGFFDHMLDQLARHSLIDLDIAAKGDLHIDFHHTVGGYRARARPGGPPGAWRSARASRAMPTCICRWTRP